MKNQEKFECADCGCFYWVEDRSNFECPNCEVVDKEYKYIYLPNGNFIQIKFEEWGIVYDSFNKHNEHIKSLGYDLYEELNLTKTK
jgi:hypothetical protein